MNTTTTVPKAAAMPADEAEHDGGRSGTIEVPLKFRFPIEKVGRDRVVMIVPAGFPGIPMLNPQFTERFDLVDSEIKDCERMILRRIAIVPEGCSPIAS
jgi:hypothetical protein